MDTFPNDNAIHDMRLRVDSKLQNRNGPIIYQKLSDINMSGNGKFASFALAAKEVFERSKANIATLWAIDLMKDISQNKNVLEFAKARTSKFSAAIGPDILIPGHLNGMSTSDEFVQLTGKFKQRFL